MLATETNCRIPLKAGFFLYYPKKYKLREATGCIYTEKLSPQAQVLLAFGLVK